MAFAADRPSPGFYLSRLVRGGPLLPVRIWELEPADPVTGEPLDRPLNFAWEAEIDGKPVDVWRVWPGCARNPITPQEVAVGGRIVTLPAEAVYRQLLDAAAWDRSYDPSSPLAAPELPADYRQMKPIF